MEDFGAGTVTLVGDRLLVIRENGEAIVALALPEAGVEVSTAARRRTDLPALADARLYVRNANTLAAYFSVEVK